MKQIKLKSGNLLDEFGNLVESGYATSLVKTYERSLMKKHKMRIKEWDYYYLGNDEIGIALTIADNSYMSLMSVSYLDFKEKTETTKSVMNFMTKGKTKLPSTSKIGDVSFKNKKINISFLNDGKYRLLSCLMPKFKNGLDLTIDLQIEGEPAESMVIATPFDKKGYYYYNQKINCLHATGTIKLGDVSIEVNDFMGVLDWGRGIWTYKNTWYWSSMSGIIDGVDVGFNLGYGFGCNTSATENMIFYNKVAYKVDEVVFNIPTTEKGQCDFLKEWSISSNDGKIDLKFVPIVDRFSDSNAVIIRSLQHQVFGHFSGTLMVNGQKLVITDMMGFAEKVYNRW